jgi:hypothetical protein
LSDWERRILRDMEQEMETSDRAFVTVFRRRLDPARRLTLAAALLVAGAVVALAAFAFSLAAATAGLAAMGAGLGLGAGPMMHMDRGGRARHGEDRAVG